MALNLMKMRLWISDSKVVSSRRRYVTASDVLLERYCICSMKLLQKDARVSTFLLLDLQHQDGKTIRNADMAWA